jgi:dihydrofolate reductase
MSKLTVFNFTTLNGYFEGPNHDLGWHHKGGEPADFAVDMLGNDGTLLFGRVTYQMMASYWPTPLASEHDAEMAKGMNAADKVVFSRTLRAPEWHNSRLATGTLHDEVLQLKQRDKDACVLGSGSLVTQLAEANLVDEYSFMIDPVALGEGTPLFKGLRRTLDLKLTASRVFANGAVLLTYRPTTLA